jgi:hypothetical protein
MPVSVRLQALIAYSGTDPPTCRWCGSPDCLELDHIDGGKGQGTAHRRDMARRGTNINYELRRLGYPPGYQCLCHECHQMKSYAKELKPMAATASGDEKTAKNFYLRRDVIAQIEKLAKEKGISPSQLIEDLALATTEGTDGHQQKLLGVLHQRHTDLTAAVETLVQQIGITNGKVAQVQNDVLDLKRDLKNMDTGVLRRILDTVISIHTWTQKSWLKR